MRIGVISVLFPTERRPAFGIFVKDELDHLIKYVDIRLIAPLPNQSWFEKGKKSMHEPYPVIRPFTLAFPRWFLQKQYPNSMAYTLKKYGRAFFDGCDIVHAHNAFPDCVASVKVFGKKIPVIVTVHGSDVNVFAMKLNLRPDIVHALNNVNRIICVSNSLSDKLKEIGVTSKTEIISNGIDTGLFFPGDRTSACKFLGIDPDRPRIIFAGNFYKIKGIEYLIQSMPLVLQKYPDCELILLGAQPGRKDIVLYRDSIVSAKIENAVRIVTKVAHEKLPVWMQASDLLVLPSLKEGFGIVAAEALACGKPVVATKSGGPEDIVEEGLGFLVPPGNFEALGEGILRVLDGTGILNSNAMAESIKSRFSYESITQKIVGVYKEVLNE
ncbi:MAG TPA: glycosyltransferase family 4 protein [bacterium]|nr:glycosyltransferase family 4 protein [bacterium]